VPAHGRRGVVHVRRAGEREAQRVAGGDADGAGDDAALRQRREARLGDAAEVHDVQRSDDHAVTARESPSRLPAGPTDRRDRHRQGSIDGRLPR
jgi:hypothetical protein